MPRNSSRPLDRFDASAGGQLLLIAFVLFAGARLQKDAEMPSRVTVLRPCLTLNPKR